MEGLAKIGGPIIGFGLVGYGIYYGLSNNPHILTNALWALAAVIAIFVFCFVVLPAMKDRKIYEAAPADGPMKINISMERLGKKHRLHIDVTMSKADQLALKNSGLEAHSLFRFPDPKNPEIEYDYCNLTLLHKKYVDFPNIQDCDYAKAQLIEGLYALRTRLDQQKDHERQASRPEGTRESFEL